MIDDKFLSILEGSHPCHLGILLSKPIPIVCFCYKQVMTQTVGLVSLVLSRMHWRCNDFFRIHFIPKVRVFHYIIAAKYEIWESKLKVQGS